jgi:hypothetical protein
MQVSNFTPRTALIAQVMRGPQLSLSQLVVVFVGLLLLWGVSQFRSK